MRVKWSRPTVVTLLVLFFISLEECEVEATPKDVIPVPGWFSSVEGFVLPNLNNFQPKDRERIQARHIVHLASEEDEQIRRKRRKKKKKLAKDTLNFIKDDEARKLEGTKKKKKRKKKKKLKKKSLFVKSQVKDKDSALSASKERLKKKPVDIIVHIKMNDQ